MNSGRKNAIHSIKTSLRLSKIGVGERMKNMLNKNELEKIVIHSAEELKVFEGQILKDKYLILNIVAENIKLDTLEGCIIEGGGLSCRKLTRCNLFDADYVYADEMHLSVFQRCEKIQCGDLGEGYKVMASQFVHCGNISIYDAMVEDCIFTDFKTLYITDVSMQNCIISDITCDNDCAISMEDSEIRGCSFENIALENNSYLIEGYGFPSVETSVFMNIRTSRSDYEIFHMEETKGILFKKCKEYNFFDEDSCSGLDLIPILSRAKTGGENE